MVPNLCLFYVLTVVSILQASSIPQPVTHTPSSNQPQPQNIIDLNEECEDAWGLQISPQESENDFEKFFSGNESKEMLHMGEGKRSVALEKRRNQLQLQKAKMTADLRHRELQRMQKRHAAAAAGPEDSGEDDVPFMFSEETFKAVEARLKKEVEEELTKIPPLAPYTITLQSITAEVVALNYDASMLAGVTTVDDLRRFCSLLSLKVGN